MSQLPIDPLLPRINAALRANPAVVVQASPGAGKTTRVPTALLDAGLAGDGQILVLEPRRIAARAAAEFVARERGGQVGGEVGYRVRFDQRGSDATRLWFVTEGVFTRQLGRNSFLDGISVVVLDEFHERHVQADLALAAVLELQRSVRPDLKLVVMSATLEAERVAAHLGADAPIRSEGRSYPVALEHLLDESGGRLHERVAAAAARVLSNDASGGDILVFLPGAGEIRRAAEALATVATAHDVEVVPLHGDLPLPEQYNAIQKGSRRKLILATNVAETALTVEGVTVVIDSGLARVARFDTRHGINSLSLARISRASAEQRAGRAGRVRPGRCLRLWSVADHQGRVLHDAAEIRRLDLTELLLELRAWGLADARQLPWLDPPSEAAWRRAENLLRLLGALDLESNQLTEIGRRMLRLSLAPRLARILIEAERRGCAARATTLAALASERDIRLDARALRGIGAPAGAPPAASEFTPSQSSDLLVRLDLFEQAEVGGFSAGLCRALRLDPTAVRSVERVRRQLARSFSAAAADRDSGAHAESELLRCVLAGFPDRVVRRRAPRSPRGRMVGGTGVTLSAISAVRDAELFVAVEVDGGKRAESSEAQVRVASAIERRWLEEMFPTLIRSVREPVFDWEREAVIERRSVRFQDLVLEESVRASADRAASGAALAVAVQVDPARALAISPAIQLLLDRIAAGRRWLPELELPDPGELLARTAADLCEGRASFAELRRIDLMPWLQSQLSSQWRQLERELPSEYLLPSGRRVEIRYQRDRPPVVAARIQELFGLAATPRLARGRVPLLMELLAPNQRPVQITDDLASFWRGTYLEVRKQLRGRYPKHAWPEDPWSATPSSRVRRGSA